MSEYLTEQVTGVNPAGQPKIVMLVDSEHPCDHHESLYGRCTVCGMTWEQQARNYIQRQEKEA